MKHTTEALSVWVLGEELAISPDNAVIVPTNREDLNPCVDAPLAPMGALLSAGEAIAAGLWTRDRTAYVLWPNGAWWLADLL